MRGRVTEIHDYVERVGEAAGRGLVAAWKWVALYLLTKEGRGKAIRHVADKAMVGTDRWCSPHHRMPCNSEHEGSKCV